MLPASCAAAPPADYLKDRYGHGSEKTLAKLACLGGGPEFHKAGERVVLYTREDSRHLGTRAD